MNSTLTATRVQGGWQLFRENGETVKFTGQYFSCEPKNQDPVTIKAAHVAMILANSQRKAKR